MHRFLIAGLVVLALAWAGNKLAVNAAETKEEQVLRHVVLFKFTDDESAQKIADAFKALEPQIDVIKAFEWGTNVSQEGLDKGFTHLFRLSFAKQEDLDTYLNHPAHKDFVAGLAGRVDDVCVFDYWTSKTADDPN